MFVCIGSAMRIEHGSVAILIEPTLVLSPPSNYTCILIEVFKEIPYDHISRSADFHVDTDDDRRTSLTYHLSSRICIHGIIIILG